MTTLNILSGGAAQGLVASLAEKFKAHTGFDIFGEFGAVGAMADKLRTGQPTDVVILTAALVAKLAEERLVLPGSIRDIGLVETALAVRSGDANVLVQDADDLRRNFLAADAIYVPDVKTSTAGIHIAKVLDDLGIAGSVEARLKIYPNGAAAMRALAASEAARALGCTQSTEIIATAGIKLSGSLPKGCDLATMYSVGITARSTHATPAQSLIELLISADTAGLRAQAGFLNAEVSPQS